MTEPQFILDYQALGRAEQIRFLVFLSAQLTVHARGTYEAGSERLEDPARLREINEFQHRLSFHLLHLMWDQVSRYPDAVFAEIVWDFAQATGAEKLLVQSLRAAAPAHAAAR